MNELQNQKLNADLVVLSACETPNPNVVNKAPSAESIPSGSESPGESRRLTTKPAIPDNPSAAKPADPAVPPVAEAPQPPKPEQLLAEGKDLYDKGDFRAAIRKLISARDTAEQKSVVQQASLKLLAFCYCVTNQRPLCNTQFTTLLNMDPSFELSRAESGHPLWGPEFRKAKTASQPKPAKKS